MYIITQFCFPISQSGEIRHTLRIPLCWLGLALLPFLPYGSPALPSPLLPSPLFRHPTFMWCLRPRHFDTPAKSEAANCRGANCVGYLELPTLEPSCIW